MSSTQVNHHQHLPSHNANVVVPAAPGIAQRQSPATAAAAAAAAAAQIVHDHSRPLPPPPSPFSTGQTTTASFRSVSRSPLPPINSTTSSAATRTVTTSSSTSSSSSTTQQQGEVSLEAPRPDGERLANEYVETPFRPNSQQQQHKDATTTTTTTTTNKKHHAPSSNKQQQHCATSKHHRRNGPITKQPVSFTKEPASQQRTGTQLSGSNQQAADTSSLSIMCERCGKCRCESCREPPPLPSRWLCDNSCLCSAETVLDYASCLCCAKGLFYHCSLASNDDATACADEPCSCVGPRRLARWSCLSALALVLPCLLCYWPLKGCVALCEAGYAKHASQGCRCEQPELGEKRLLAPESS